MYMSQLWPPNCLQVQYYMSIMRNWWLTCGRLFYTITTEVAECTTFEQTSECLPCKTQGLTSYTFQAYWLTNIMFPWEFIPCFLYMQLNQVVTAVKLNSIGPINSSINAISYGQSSWALINVGYTIPNLNMLYNQLLLVGWLCTPLLLTHMLSMVIYRRAWGFYQLQPKFMKSPSEQRSEC